MKSSRNIHFILHYRTFSYFYIILIFLFSMELQDIYGFHRNLVPLNRIFKLSGNNINYNRRDKEDKGIENRKPSISQSARATRATRSPRSPSLQDNIKLARFARTLRDELSDIIGSMDIKAINYPDDDLLRGTAIVDVEVSPDMLSAKIIISVLGNSVEKRKVYLWLCENVGQVRYSLAKRIRYVRRIPTLLFKLMDPQTAEVMNIMEQEAIMRQLNAQKLDREEVEFEEEEEEEEEEKK